MKFLHKLLSREIKSSEECNFTTEYRRGPDYEKKKEETRCLIMHKDIIEHGDFHIHTTYTDGNNSMEEYCIQGLKNDLRAIAFTEHVRKDMSYDFERYICEIESLEKKFTNLTIFRGCEARVTNAQGELDASDHILMQCDIVIGVFHHFENKSKRGYLNALKAMLNNRFVDIWGHPLLFPTTHKIRLQDREIEEVIEICTRNDIMIERNIKHQVPNADFVKLAFGKAAKFIVGSDAHSVNDLLTINQLKGEWKWIAKMC